MATLRIPCSYDTERIPLEKACSRCGKTKPLQAFARTSNVLSGRRAQCRDCCGTYNRAWNQGNRASCDAATRRWRENNPEKVRANKTAWRLANPENVRRHKRDEYEKHREQIIQRVMAWSRANPDLRRAQNLRRRSLQAKAAGADYTTAAMIAARVEMYGGLCRYCAALWESIDHRIPIARGGSHWPANLVPVCKSCNSRKHDKTESEFLALLAREEVTP